MGETLYDRAKHLAARPYTVRILKDESAGEGVLYVAINPELDGCLAEGDSIEEAKANLAEFRIEYIEHLLEHGLPVPEPTSTATFTSFGDPQGGGELKLNLKVSGAEPEDLSGEVVQIDSPGIAFS